MHILIFAMEHYWIGPARLPKALQAAGFRVGVLCFPESYIAKTRYIDKLFTLELAQLGSTFLKSLSRAIEVWHPVLLIPGDEITVRFIHRVVQMAATGHLNSLPRDVLEVIQSSLCNPNFYEATTNKSVTQQVAGELSLRIPAQKSFDSVTDAERSEHSYPVVLKKSVGSGGDGVKICENEQQFLEALYNFKPQPTKPPGIKSVIKNYLRKLFTRSLDPTQLEIAQLPGNSVVNIQQFIRGKPAMYCFIATSGRILGGYAAVKEIVNPSPTGMSSVVHFIKQPEMASAASALIAHFAYTGFGSIEFMLEEETGFAYLLECNPRPTSINHLGEEVGVNLCQALYDQLSGEACTPLLSVKSEMVVALFPQEWNRDPGSPYLLNAYHDVPWDDPVLVRAYMGLS